MTSSLSPRLTSAVAGRDFLASIVVFLVALPLCMGIAIASGAPPALGLITGIVGGLVVGSLAGSPLQVSGPAAGMAVLVYQLVNEHGLMMLGVVGLIAGGLQLLAGVLKLGQWFRAISPSVIHGMLAGIGVLIFASQLHVMLDDAPRANGLLNIAAIPEAVIKAIEKALAGELQGWADDPQGWLAQLILLGLGDGLFDLRLFFRCGGVGFPPGAARHTQGANTCTQGRTVKGRMLARCFRT